MKKQIITAIIAIALLMGSCKTGDKKNTSTGKNDTLTSVIDSSKLKDSLKNAANASDYEGDEEGPYYPENIVINASIPADAAKGFSGLKFGNKVYIDPEKSNDNTTVFYLQNPLEVKTAQSYSASADYFISSSEYEEYQRYFSLPAFAALPPGVKKIILDNDYDNGNQYATTQNEDRSKNVTAYADYDGDGIKDVAIVLDNNEKQISRLLIICTNKASKRPYMAYAENYNDKVRINSYKAGSKVFMNSPSLVPAPIDGLIIQGEDIKLAIMYHKNLQKYKTYYQEASYSEEE